LQQDRELIDGGYELPDGEMITIGDERLFALSRSIHC
jgi:hypothetical protein